MNTRTLIAAITLGLVGITGCTAQQRHMAANAIDQPAQVAEEPIRTINVDADCSYARFTLTGLPANLTVFLGVESEPPYSATTDENGYVTGAVTILPWILNYGGYGFYIDVPSTGERLSETHVVC